MKKFLILLLLSYVSPVPGLGQDSTDWLLLYYVPYDNNLSHYADSIIDQVNSSKSLKHAKVVLQVDRSDNLGMIRYEISNEGTTTDTIPSERSTHRKNVTRFFKWAAKSFASRRTAIFILDHGGGLNELGQDLNPDSTFIKMNDLRKSLFRYRDKTNSKIDLLYMQVCAKASIEPLYEVSAHVKYTLASQKLLGAPNYYYKAMLDFIDKNPNCSEKQLAEVIASSDRKDMYETLTCIDNSAFLSFKKEFLRFVDMHKDKEKLEFAKAPAQFSYANDKYWDLVDFLLCLNLSAPDEIAQRDALISILNTQLISFIQYSNPSHRSKFSGVSIAALSKQRVTHYWRKMLFHNDFRVDRLPIN